MKYRRVTMMARQLLLLVVLSLQMATGFGADYGPEEIARDNKQVEGLIAAGSYLEARRITARVLAQDPDNEVAIYQDGLIDYRTGEYQSALEKIRRAVELAPEHVEFRFALGLVYEFLGSMDEAEAAFDRVMEDAGKGSDMYREARKKKRFIMATRYAQRGELNTAVELFTWLVEEYPEDVQSRYSLGIAKMLMGRLEEAEGLFRKVLEMAPEHIDAHFTLADLYQRSGRLSAAVDILNRLLALPSVPQPARQRAQVRLGLIEARALARSGNYADALDVFATVLAIDGSNLEALYGKGRVYYDMGQYGNAIEYLNRVLAANPAHEEARWYLANAQIEAGELEAGVAGLEALVSEGAGRYARNARERLNELAQNSAFASVIISYRVKRARQRLEEDPGDIASRRLIADYYLSQGEQGEAAREYEIIVVQDPFNLGARLRLAGIYEQGGRMTDALEQYAWVVALLEDEDRAAQAVNGLLLTLAKLQYQEREPLQAEATAEMVVRRDPGNPEAYFVLGLIKAREKKTEEAISAFKKILAIAPDHFGARMNLALNYQQLGREEDALAIYREISQIEGLRPDYLEMVENQITTIERSIMGFTGAMNYVVTYNDNVNQSEVASVEDVRSDLVLNVAYQYKADNGVSWRLAVLPLYSSYHMGQYDYLNTTTSLTASIRPEGRYSLSLGLSGTSVSGLINSQGYSSQNRLTLNYGKELLFPELFRPWSGRRASTRLSAGWVYADVESKRSPFFSARVNSLNLGVGQPLGAEGQFRLSYARIENRNTEAVGSDYAYVGHNVNFRYERSLATGLVANVVYGFGKYYYTYPDSYSGFSRYRDNDRQNFSVGGSYYYKNRIRFFASYDLTINDSNLPVGVILNARDVIEGQQSSSLGDYTASGLSAGMSMTF